jgi:hypothetical protein
MLTVTTRLPITDILVTRQQWNGLHVSVLVTPFFRTHSYIHPMENKYGDGEVHGQLVVVVVVQFFITFSVQYT